MLAGETASRLTVKYKRGSWLREKLQAGLTVEGGNCKPVDGEVQAGLMVAGEGASGFRVKQ